MPPLVLVLDEARVGPLHDSERQDVVAWLDGIGDVELGSQVGVLADPDLLAIDGHDEDAFGGADIEDDSPAGPSFREVERPLEDTRRIVRGGMRRTLREGHLHVRVLRQVREALERPDAGDVYLAPRVQKARVRSRQQLKPPTAVEHDAVVVGHRVHRQPADRCELGRFPGHPNLERRGPAFCELGHALSLWSEPGIRGLLERLVDR